MEEQSKRWCSAEADVFILLMIHISSVRCNFHIFSTSSDITPLSSQYLIAYSSTTQQTP